MSSFSSVYSVNRGDGCSPLSPSTSVQTSTPVLSAQQSSIQKSTPVASTSINLPTSTPPPSHNDPRADIQQSTPLSSHAAVENPLVRAGLVPQHLADILATPRADEASNKRPSR